MIKLLFRKMVDWRQHCKHDIDSAYVYRRYPPKT